MRWHRMRGFDTLWQPGYDHAGISTQNVVEKQLVAEGTSRQEVGRDAFLERTWSWLDATGRTIMGQFRRLGASLDYSRERFTMDDAYVEAVMTFFVRLWDAGWIYRANRIVNWCPHHRTAISDLEVEHVEMDDTLFHVRYPFADGDGVDGITIATVRPSTILADVAVAVHPDDERYRGAVGREVVVPVVERRVPVIADERVDPGVRHRRAQDHARATTRPTSRSAHARSRDAHGDRARRPDGRRRASRASTRRRPTRGSSPGSTSGAAREARAVPPLRRHLRTLPLADRAARVAAVVVRDGRARAPGDRGAPRAARPVTTRRASTGSRSSPSSRRPTGASRASSGGGTRSRSGRAPTGTGRAPGRRPRRAASAARRSSSATPTCSTRGSRRRSGRSRRSAGPEQTPELDALLPGRRQLTAREIIRLWENRMIFSGLFLLGEIPFTDVIIHVDGARARRAADVEEPRHGDRPDGGGRGARRGCDALRPAQDLVDAGRPLLAAGDRGGPQARDQALERRAPDPPARRGGDARRSARRRSRSAGSSRGSTPRAARARGRLEPVRLRRRDRRALPPHVRRLLRLVRGGGQAAALRRRRGRARDGSRGARAAARAPPSARAARDGGDLVAPPGPRRTADRLGLARAGRGVRRGARRPRPRPGRGAGVSPERRPGRAARRRGAAHLRRGRATGAPPRRRRRRGRAVAAAAGRSRARRACSRTSGSSRTRRPRSSRRSAPSSSGTAASWSSSGADDRCPGRRTSPGSRASRRGRRTASARSGCARSSSSSASRSRACPRSTSSGRTASRRRRGWWRSSCARTG